MQRTLKLALASVLGAALVVPALAQDNFPDVPDNHWAYEALLRLKSNGLLVGYPDGLFRGNRPASRYEMAVAIHATYVNLKNITDGLQAQIDALKNAGPNADIQNLRTALENLQNDVNNLKKYGDDIANLRRLTDQFQKELQDLNVDVEQMKKDLSDLNDRVTKLEARRPAVDVHGDANLWIGAGNSRDGRYGLNKDGRIVGARVNNGQLQLTGGEQDLTVLHEAAFTFTTTKETGPKFAGTLVAGNMLADRIALGGTQLLPGTNTPVAFGDQSQYRNFIGRNYTEGTTDIYFQEFGVKFDSSIASLAFNAEIGRVGYKISPYIFQRIDNTTYFANDRWDNGKYLLDGGILTFNLGGAKVTGFGGRTSRRFTSNGNEIQPLLAGQFQGYGSQTGVNDFVTDRVLGANVNVPLSTNGSVDLSYLLLDSDNGFNVASSTGGGLGFVSNLNRIEVFGATGKFNVSGFEISGGYAQTNARGFVTSSTAGVGVGSRARNTRDNAAYNVGIGYNREKFGIEGGFRRVESRFVAPGDWGRIGILRNPTNIEGFQVKGFANLGNALVLKGNADFLRGARDDAASSTFTYFNRNTEITSFNVGLDYKFNSNVSLMASYEEARFRKLVGAAAGIEPKYRWLSFGLGYGLSDTTRLSIAYELSDHDNDVFVSTLNPAAPSAAGGNYRGGFLTTQLTVKF